MTDLIREWIILMLIVGMLDLCLKTHSTTGAVWMTLLLIPQFGLFFMAWTT